MVCKEEVCYLVSVSLHAGTAQTATCVLCLMNMVTPEELEDDEEYEGERQWPLHS